jgi:protein-tyrosine phosphatase
MAEVLLRAALANEGGKLAELHIVSAGIGAYPGDAASAHAVKALDRIGFDLSNHCSCPLDQGTVDRAIAIFGMAAGHVEAVKSRFGNLPQVVQRLREQLPLAAGRDIPDPFGGNLAEYEACRDSVIEAIPSVVACLRERFA